MTNLSNAVAKTINTVFEEIDISTDEIKKRISSLKANIGKIANIPIEEIETNENIRKTVALDSENFLRLVESVKKYGVLENVVVELRLNKKETDYKLVCIAGHRRIFAAKAAKTITKIPCLLQSYTNRSDGIGAALAENLNREDLHCIDVADGYRSLVELGWTEDELAKHFCRDIRTIRHYLKMSGWSDDIKNLLRENPAIFSTRVIMRQFAYKKFTSTNELKNRIKDFLYPKNAAKNAHTKISKKENASGNSHDKKSMKKVLNAYLEQQKLLSEIIKEEIKKAFVELNLI
jgi:ParB/RepB/Spo0J family partition protein